jgi:glycerol-3-phosphate dehydrogenase (NAD(P)+)
MNIRNIAIIGGGAMGTALAINLSKKQVVTLVVRSERQLAELTLERTNSRYFPGARIPDAVRIEASMEIALRDADLALVATPVSAFSQVLDAVVSVRPDVPVLWACKGFCPHNGEPLSVQVESRLAPGTVFGALSGPSFAEGLAANDPTALVVATRSSREISLSLAESLSNQTLRVYANDDLVGVQICGAIKNVYAIAAGVIDGCGWGANTRAAMMTRAVAEAERYLRFHRAQPSTLMGLSGFGDIYLTCGSRISRNYQVGLALATGVSLDQALRDLGHVAEGVHTTRLVQRRAVELGLEMPLVAAVSDVLDGRKTPRECAAALMGRDIGYESRNPE